MHVLQTACTLLQWRADQFPVDRVEEKACRHQAHILGWARVPYMIFFFSPFPLAGMQEK